MIDHVVVDVEIAHIVEETPGGWDATDKLGISVACVWEYTIARMRVYGPDDVKALRSRLLRADRISGFNVWNFDFPVIWGISKPDWKGMVREDNRYLKDQLGNRCNDLLRRIWQAKGLDPDKFDDRTHGGVGLDMIAQATLGVKKIGYGGDAPKWYQAGQVQRVVNYCADDTALERDLTDFVDRYGYVITGGKQLYLK